ncbi:MAG: prolipoprotein diacylglyceryl transferase [Methyloceanibacter sp.]
MKGRAGLSEPSPMPLLAIPYPVIDPVAIAIGPVSVRWYGLAYMAGILLGWLYGRYLVSRPELWGGKSPMTVSQADDFLLWITLGIVVGGRLGFVLFYEPSYFWQHPAEIPVVWNGGMSFHGGLLGVVLAVYFFSRVKGINPLSLGDVAAAATPFGLFFGRIANFINGELVGRESGVPWAMVFPGEGDAPRHPSQLYEAFLEGIVLFIILRIATYRYLALTRPGTVFGLFLVFYGIFRSVVEFAREPHPGHPMDIGLFTPGVIYSVPMILIGLWLIWRARREPAVAAS